MKLLIAVRFLECFGELNDLASANDIDNSMMMRGQSAIAVRSRARGGGAPDNNSFDPTADWMPLIIFDCDGGWMPFAAAAQFERSAALLKKR